MRTTLTGLQEHFMTLYGQRILVVDGSLPVQVLRFQRQVGKMVDAVRKEKPLGPRVAAAFNSLMNLANHFNGHVSVARGMMIKFPARGCAYCGSKPCSCKKQTRPQPVFGLPNTSQERLSLKGWQAHQHAVYGTNHEGLSVYEILCRLTSELSEISALATRSPHTPNNVTDMLREAELEIADTLSWLLAFANKTAICVEKEVVNMYETCPVCHHIPCTCSIVFLSSDGTISHTGHRETAQ